MTIEKVVGTQTSFTRSNAFAKNPYYIKINCFEDVLVLYLLEDISHTTLLIFFSTSTENSNIMLTGYSVVPYCGILSLKDERNWT